jgi:flagellar biosynthesis protein FliQ
MVVGLVAALVEAKRVSIAKDNNLIFNPKAVVMFKSLFILKFKSIENDRFN